MSQYEEKPKRTEQYELADVGTRLIALIIDGVVLGIISGLLFAFAREPGVAGGFIVGLIYQWYFLTQRDGQTPR